MSANLHYFTVVKIQSYLPHRLLVIEECNEIFFVFRLCLEFMLDARHLDLPSKLNVDRHVQLELDRVT